MKGYLQGPLIVLGVLAMLLFAGGLDGWKQEAPYSRNISLQNDVGWLDHSANVSTFEYNPIPREREEFVIVEFDHKGTEYSTRMWTPAGERMLGVYEAPIEQLKYEDLMLRKDNTSQSGIFLESTFIDRDNQNVRYYYAIISDREEVFYADRSVPYGVSGYRSEITDDGRGTAIVRYIPDAISYFWNCIFGNWIALSAGVILVVRFIENRKKG